MTQKTASLSCCNIIFLSIVLTSFPKMAPQTTLYIRIVFFLGIALLHGHDIVGTTWSSTGNKQSFARQNALQDLDSGRPRTPSKFFQRRSVVRPTSNIKAVTSGKEITVEDPCEQCMEDQLTEALQYADKETAQGCRKQLKGLFCLANCHQSTMSVVSELNGIVWLNLCPATCRRLREDCPLVAGSEDSCESIEIPHLKSTRNSRILPVRLISDRGVCASSAGLLSKSAATYSQASFIEPGNGFQKTPQLIFQASEHAVVGPTQLSSPVESISPAGAPVPLLSGPTAIPVAIPPSPPVVISPYAPVASPLIVPVATTAQVPLPISSVILSGSTLGAQPPTATMVQPMVQPSSTTAGDQTTKCGFCFNDCCCWPVWASSIAWFFVGTISCFISVLLMARLYSKGFYSENFYETGGMWLIGAGAFGLLAGSLIGGLVPMCIAGALYLGSSLMAFSMSICLLGRRGAWLGAIGGMGCGGVTAVLFHTGRLGISLGVVIGLLVGLIVGFAPFARTLKMNDRYIRRGLTQSRSHRQKYAVGDAESEGGRYIAEEQQASDQGDSLLSSIGAGEKHNESLSRPKSIFVPVDRQGTRAISESESRRHHRPSISRLATIYQDLQTSAKAVSDTET